nr:YbjN domain-containing protein [uncultured Dethiosulfovibrio sp.]
MKKFICLLIVCAFLAFGTSAFAELPTVVDRATIQDVVDLLGDEGYRSDIDDENSCTFKIQGYNAQIILYNDGEALQFHASWVNSDATLESLNHWNQNWRFGRAYLDEKGNPHLEVDLDLAGGVTVDRIKDYIRTCQDLIVNFAKEAI